MSDEREGECWTTCESAPPDYSMESFHRAAELMRSAMGAPPRKIVLVMHPDNVESVVRAVLKQLGGRSLALCRISVQPSDYVPKLRWQGPIDRFVDYDTVDENWAKPLGMGQMVPAVYEVDAESMNPFKEELRI